MRLAKDFTLEELCVTNTGLQNTPEDREQEKLLYLCQYILQPIRDAWGVVIITSGFRDWEVNKKIGGAINSQHLYGEAADFYPKQSDIDDVFKWCIKNLKFGQCIRESKNGKDWIHISLPRIGKNQEALIYENGIYRRA